mmetsp:Transcript_66716/g.214967  ORF Transcript_66716/g.214967 Transcript_66716/m.214967 type:complete len:233 (-) Transcript_66716:582-1280(-)
MAPAAAGIAGCGCPAARRPSFSRATRRRREKATNTRLTLATSQKLVCTGAKACFQNHSDSAMSGTISGGGASRTRSVPAVAASGRKWQTANQSSACCSPDMAWATNSTWYRVSRCMCHSKRGSPGHSTRSMTTGQPGRTSPRVSIASKASSWSWGPPSGCSSSKSGAAPRLRRASARQLPAGPRSERTAGAAPASSRTPWATAHRTGSTSTVTTLTSWTPSCCNCKATRAAT